MTFFRNFIFLYGFRHILITFKPSFANVDKLLNEWKKLGITTPEQIVNMKKPKKSSSATVPPKSQTLRRDYDMSALEKQLLDIN